MNECERCGKEYKSHTMTVELRGYHEGLSNIDKRYSDAIEVWGICPECGAELLDLLWKISWIWKHKQNAKNPRAQIPQDFIDIITEVKK